MQSFSKKIIIAVMLCVATSGVCAQGLSGCVEDEKGEPLTSAVVKIYAHDTIKGGNVTDYAGNIIIRPLSPGQYHLYAFLNGYDSLITDITVKDGALTAFSCQLKHESPDRIPWHPPYCGMGRSRLVDGGSLAGIITDKGKHPVKGATVRMLIGTRLIDEAVTDSTGRYYLIQLYHENLYTIKVTAPTFKPVSVMDMFVSNGPGVTKADFTLLKATRKYNK